MHLGFWLGVVLLFVLYESTYNESWWGYYETIVNKLCYLPSQILIAYPLIYYQIPDLLYKGRYLTFGVSLVLNAYLASVFARIMKVYVYESLLMSGLEKDSVWSILTEPAPLLGQYLPWVFMVPLCMLMLKLIKEYFEQQEQALHLAQARKEAEMRLLKAQVHPHFLFNTLNNLYILSLEKAPETPVLIGKLAEMLDYMFGSQEGDWVSVQQEKQLLEQYIQLEALRYGDRLELQFEHDIESENIKMAPLLLIAFVENAFKHGASGDLGQPKVHIKLKASENHIFFNVWNTKPAQVQDDPQAYREGIGLKNVRRQLLLRYPGQHELQIREEPHTFEITLHIHLDTMVENSVKSTAYA